MMLQELHARWKAIQNREIEFETLQDRIAEELNILEALRICGCTTIPRETSDVKILITERHKQLEEALRKRKG